MILKLKKFKIKTSTESSEINTLRAGDIVRRQYIDNNKSIYSLMYVEEAGVDKINTENGERVSHYFIGLLLYGDEPKTDELLNFVRVTSLSDRDRSGAIYMTSNGDNSPFLDVIEATSPNNAMFFPDNILDFSKPTNVNINFDTVNRGFKFTNAGGVDVSFKSDTIKNNTKFAMVYFDISSSKLCDVDVSIGGFKKVIKSTKDIQHIFIPVATDDLDSQFTIDFISKDLKINGDSVSLSNMSVFSIETINGLVNATKTRVGKLDGIVDDSFGDISGYGGYFQKLYATKDVNISGTFTAGNQDGFGSVFYVGKISTNLIENSTKLTQGANKAKETSKSIVGIGNSYEVTGTMADFIIPTDKWKEDHLNERLCFSLFVNSNSKFSVELNGVKLEYEATSNWARVIIPVFLTKKGNLTVKVNGKGTLYTAPQLELGNSATLYQPTDGKLSISDKYGMWASEGGFGGTIQNPLLTINADGNGAIESKNSGFKINADGSGHLGGGALTFDNKSVKISFKDSNLNDEIDGKIDGVSEELNGKIDNATAIAKDAQDSINGLEIGTSNLVLKSNASYCFNEGSSTTPNNRTLLKANAYELQDVLESNTNHIVSIYAKGKGNIIPYILGSTQLFIFKIDSDDYKWYHSGVINKPFYKSRTIHLYTESNIGFIGCINKILITKGNKQGDWSLNIEDQKAELDKQITSVRTDFDIREGQISASVKETQELVNTTTELVEETKEISAGIKVTADKIDSQAKEVSQKADEVKENATNVSQTAGSVNVVASEVKKDKEEVSEMKSSVEITAQGVSSTAEKVNEAKTEIDQTAEGIKQTASNINNQETSINQTAESINQTAKEVSTNATKAEEQAKLATTKATEANKASVTASAKAEEANKKALEANAKAEEALISAGASSEAYANAKLEADKANKDALKANAEATKATAEATKAKLEADKAIKAQADVALKQTEINQTSEAITLTATEVSENSKKAIDASTTATAKANEASANATKAKADAVTANTKAIEANKKAEEAKASAGTSSKAYQDAKAEAVKANADATKANAEATKSANEAAKAKLEADKATKASADIALKQTEINQTADSINLKAKEVSSNTTKAEAEAKKAQASATTAQTNATNATNKAKEAQDNAAKTKADATASNQSKLDAQKKADEAKAEAVKANADAAKALAEANRAKAEADKALASQKVVTQKETAINQTASKVEISAKRSEDSAVRSEKAEASINMKADGIVMEASKQSAEKAIDGLEIGGRNLLLDTYNLSEIQVYNSRGTITSKGNKSYTIIPQKDVNAGVMLLFSEILKSDTEYTLAFDVESNIATTLNYLDLRNNGTWAHIGNNRVRLPNQPIKAGLNSIKVTFKTGNATGTSTLNALWNAINSPYDLELTYSNLRLMEGNKPTDWTPAPEDIDQQFQATNSKLELLSDQFKVEVAKTDGTQKELTLLKQDHEGFKLTVEKDIAGAIDDNNREILSSIELKGDAVLIGGETISLVGKVSIGMFGETVIENGKIRTDILETKKIVSEGIEAKDVNALTLTVDKGTIGGWKIDASKIASSNNYVQLKNTGDISNRDKWSLNSDGSGYLANKNILWDTAGKIKFGASVQIGFDNLDNTIVEGAYIRTSRIKADEIVTNDAIIKNLNAKSIKADKIDIDSIEAGSIKADKIDIQSLEAVRIRTGNLEVLDGAMIGGFKVKNNGLTNAGFNNNAYIIMRNDPQNTFVGIGANVFDYFSGFAGNARFEIGTRRSSSDSRKNVALSLLAEGCELRENNIALNIQGGGISGFGLKVTYWTHANDNTVKDIDSYIIDTSGNSHKVFYVPHPKETWVGRVVIINNRGRRWLQAQAKSSSHSVSDIFRWGWDSSNSKWSLNDGQVGFMINTGEYWQCSYFDWSNSQW